MSSNVLQAPVVEKLADSSPVGTTLKEVGELRGEPCYRSPPSRLGHEQPSSQLQRVGLTVTVAPGAPKNGGWSPTMTRRAT